ncbi:MAG: glycosyltransferase family 39 protein [Dehalococcoidia bacterium]|nr:glycosyltransferase family 39 protein [Dehalococcoidia bacterium]MDP7485493.1 glycosyltransferase family 39 protein [Dehalococcoidia bacterium]
MLVQRVLKQRDRIALWMLLPVIVGTSLRVLRLGDYDNSYYTATVASMLGSGHNFLFASFDPVGVVMVDKPPAAFWLQAASASIFGVSKWSVTLPQVLMGVASITILYWLVSSVYGRLSGLIAAMVLAVLPVAVVIDSRNEPDALVAFAALMAAFSIVKAVQTNRYRWYLIFGVVMALGFNAKMLVAFVPLPVFILFAAFAVKQPPTAILRRLSSLTIVLVILSFSWISFIGMTPKEDRPYVGSTHDNSIWTLVFEYNGLDRFTSFIGPRRPQIPALPQVQQGQTALGTAGGIPPNSFDGNYPLPSVLPEIESNSIVALSKSRLASQLGWLLPLGLISLVAAAQFVISDDVYRRPAKILNVFKADPRAAHAMLWTGWLVTGLLIFGSANATSTHPYYLVGVAIPLAAVIGIGLPVIKTAFEKGATLAWIAVLSVIGCAAYQTLGSGDYVPGWCIGVVATLIFLASILLATGLWRGIQTTSLTGFALGTTSISLLIIPAISAVNTGGQIAGPAPNLPLDPPPAGTPMGSNPVPSSQLAAPGRMPGPAGDSLLEEFIAREEKNGDITLLTTNAGQAAPFIINGVRSIAIGGFSGNDPIFSVESFRDMTSKEKNSYFLVRNDRVPTPMGDRQQEPIITYVLENWDDHSSKAGLPPNTLFKHPEN